MRKRFRHQVVFFLLRPLFRIFVYFKFSYKGKRYKSDKGYKGPYLILSNHALAMDPFLMAMSFKMPIYYVASDMIFSIPFWSKVIKYLVSPIPKTKYRSDIETIRDLLKLLKSGGSVAIFIEGNATFHGDLMPIEKSIVKLVRLVKVPILLYRIDGAYLTKPRWSSSVRRGKAVGAVTHTLTPAMVKAMDDDTLFDTIIKYIRADDYAFQKKHHLSYKGKRLAEDIESAYFYCPSCHAFNTLESAGDTVTCPCGLKLVYNTNGRFEMIAGNHYFDKTTDWYKAQIEALAEHIDTTKQQLLFTDDHEAVLEVLHSTLKEPIGQATLKLYKTHVEMIFENLEVAIEIKNVQASVQQKNKLILYDKSSKRTFYLLNHKKRNALKYVLAIEHLKGGIRL